MIGLWYLQAVCYMTIHTVWLTRFLYIASWKVDLATKWNIFITSTNIPIGWSVSLSEEVHDFYMNYVTFKWSTSLLNEVRHFQMKYVTLKWSMSLSNDCHFLEDNRMEDSDESHRSWK